MKVLFLNPPIGSWVYWGTHRAINVSHAQMAACIQEWVDGLEVVVLDCRALELDHDQMIREIEKISPDLIYMGDAYQMTGTVAIVPHYQKAAKLIKNKFSNILICVGGFYIAANYQDIMAQTPEFDYVISGETEITFAELCKALQKKGCALSSIKGLMHRKNDSIQLNEYRPLIKNLDDLPMPAYDLFPMDKYIGYDAMPFYQEIFTSRGCPFGCGICIDWVTVDPRGNKDWQKHRYKSAKLVVDELELLEKQYGKKYIHIFDLNFNPMRKRVEEFLEEMRRRKLNIKYAFLGNAHSFVRDKDLLKDLHATGFVAGIFGLEVEDAETLQKIKKGITVNHVKEVTTMFREIGIMSVITWMIGFPDDDEAKIKRRFAVLDKIDPDVQSLQMMLPVPGMPLYDEFAPYIEEFDLSKWDFHHPIVRTKYLTREELGRLAAWANQEFYGKDRRVQRLLESQKLHPYPKEIFKSYMKSMKKYANAAINEEVVI
jgi:anaerobic magnesium-protoporphyrin IX monomethyl ester cyclase